MADKETTCPYCNTQVLFVPGFGLHKLVCWRGHHFTINYRSRGRR